MKTLVLYHAKCPDGFAAAWAVWKRLGDEAEYVPCSYGDEPPDVSGREVYIVDFSFKRDVLLEMAARATKLVVLDHHVTARDDLADLSGAVPGLLVMFDMEMSGATMAWRHFHDDAPCWLVNYAEDRDLWRHELPRSKEVNAYLMAMGRTFENYSHAFDMGPEKVADLGAGCLTWLRYYVDSVKTAHRRMPFLGHDDIPVVNAPYTATSEVVGELAESAPFAVGWHQRAGGHFAYSLRSRDDFDVAALAKTMGGGGHKRAAGFVSEKPPWELPGLVVRPARTTSDFDDKSPSQHETMPTEPDERALRACWQAEAREQTLETLPAFLEKLAAHEHDYGSIVIAIGAAALGAAWAIEHSPHGGITGFQASRVTWEFLRGWRDDLEDKPLQIRNYALMLFPQYRSVFEQRLDRSTFEWLQAEAQKKLAEDSNAHPNVLAHWRSISEGLAPFGYTVKEDEP